MTEAAAETKNFTILIVDDEELLREAVAFDFRRRGYKVILADCGKEGLAVLANNRVDVVISDVRMPNGSGLELLAEIKKQNVFRPSVMFITGFADIALEEAYDLGADAVFPKPFDRKALQEAVELALQPENAKLNRNGVRIAVQLNGEMKNPPAEPFKITKILTLGRGGFFAQIEGELPRVSQLIDFTINLADDSNTAVRGKGIVRWVRDETDKPGFPRGCGVEFVEAEEGSRKLLLEHINFIKTKALIPIR